MRIKKNYENSSLKKFICHLGRNFYKTKLKHLKFNIFYPIFTKNSRILYFRDYIEIYRKYFTSRKFETKVSCICSIIPRKDQTYLILLARNMKRRMTILSNGMRRGSFIQKKKSNSLMVIMTSHV